MLYNFSSGVEATSNEYKVPLILFGDWTEHFGIYPHRKPTNALK
jgi:hypothetical protein